MKKIIAIIAGEPNSISSEIIFKSWKKRNEYKHKPFIIIGSTELLNSQKKKLNYRMKIKSINDNFENYDFSKNCMPVYNIDYKQKKPFQKISSRSNSYILKSFKAALNLVKNKKIYGFINCPIDKNYLFNKKYQGITEFLANKSKVKGKEVMLIYNKELSVATLTTHIPIRYVGKQINKHEIIAKIITLNNFYKNTLKKNPVIGILGLNPHNYSQGKISEEKQIINPAIKRLKEKKIKVIGPISPDTSFMIYKKKKIDVIFGMYHDQVLTPLKALFKFDAINITLGLPYIRVSPDHGVGIDLVGKKKSNPSSLIESIKFFNLIK